MSLKKKLRFVWLVCIVEEKTKVCLAGLYHWRTKLKIKICLAGLYRCTELVTRLQVSIKCLSTVSTSSSSLSSSPSSISWSSSTSASSSSHPQHEYHHHRHLFTGELVEIVLLPHHHIFALDLNPIVPVRDAFDFCLNVVDRCYRCSKWLQNLSGRVCSCQKPTTCPSSWTTIPNLSQFFPIEIAWKW